MTDAPKPTTDVTFRRLREDDADHLFTVLGDPQVMRFSLRGPLPRDDMPRWLNHLIKDYADGKPSQYAVLDRGDGQFLGFCGLMPFQDPDEQAEHEIGYRFRPFCWNKGIATQAVRSTLTYMFGQFPLPAIAAVVEKENIASVRVLQKTGFKYIKDTLYHDIPVMKYLITRAALPQPRAGGTS
jgi:ribosomal-protein-alanine N-acetyltransferase